LKKFNRQFVSVFLLAVFAVGGFFIDPVHPAYAATTPSLGVAAGYAVLSNTFTRNVGVTTLVGNLAYTTLSGAGSHTTSGTTSTPATAQSGTDQGAALSALASQSCDFSFGVATDLSLLAQPLTPGVYCFTAAVSIGTGGITLNGSGTYIFRTTGALTTAANSIITTTGVSACDVFWTPSLGTTLGANTTFVGTVIDDSGISVGSTATWSGRALAFGGTVTTNTDTITTPVCATATSSGPLANYSVIKHVINTNGGKAVAADFKLYLKDIQATPDVNAAPNVTDSPAPGQEAPGKLYQLRQGTYALREDVNPKYSVSYSGDCDSLGNINLFLGDNKTCIITNRDIVAPVPPLIDLVKIPSPLALPAGPGQVVYNYTVTNIGIVPMTDVTLVDDSCSGVILASGDTNHDSKLDVTETWRYTCAVNLNSTHTNTATVTGHANGLTATHVTQATVVVGAPIVAPLIHVVKIPDPLTLPANGGTVVYRYSVTNPGTVPLSNVHITDDKCTGLPTQLSGTPGDINRNNLLDPNETFNFTCISTLTSTTTNTATATGFGNGLMASDKAFATVTVASSAGLVSPATTVVPKLPKTGIGPE
jgi:uncharacterized repeat protein (TIGR01451 family)